MSDKTIRIENASRIQRILARICEANLNVILRAHNDPTVAVRGRASGIVDALGGVRVGNLSGPGSEHLKQATAVRVEFKGMSTQVAFDARILSHEQNAIILSHPRAIFSTERRQSARFQTTMEHSAFVDLSPMRENGSSTYLDSPFFDHYRDSAHFLRIQDVSEGGICALSRFPEVLNHVSRGFIDDGARLLLPMMEPVPLKVETRWVKRIRERTNEAEERYSRRALIGFEFKSPSDDLTLKIRQFVRSMNLAKAI
jgi:hypothetical protein